MSARIIVGDCRAVMANMAAESVQAIVCDPPYELGFMGKKWDGTGVSFDPATWEACKRLLAPGGYLLAFGGTRTFHRIAVAIEDAGFEIKDCLSWLYGSGFPKHISLLKPAWEPIVMAKKRGAGTINVDACRIEAAAGDYDHPGNSDDSITEGRVYGWAESGGKFKQSAPSLLGRWPANVILDEAAAEALDESVEPSQSRIGKPRSSAPGNGWGMQSTGAEYNDVGGPSRFLYVAKADRSERDKGLEGTDRRQVGMVSNTSGQHVTRRDGGAPKPAHNDHPTVKPIALMQWLVRLVTPPGGTVLDPFMGSGSTGIAADREGFHFIGIEQNERYAEIARLRIIGDAPLFAGVGLDEGAA